MLASTGTPRSGRAAPTFCSAAITRAPSVGLAFFRGYHFVHASGGDFPGGDTGRSYRPGQEIDAAAGVVYNGWTIDGGRIAISPLLQVLAGARAHDSGPASNSQNSGYERVLLSPGVEVAAGNWKLYGDVELPVYQHVVGNQLTAPALFKVVASRTF